jgi:hypothetical protein
MEEQDQVKHGPYLLVAQMFAHNNGRDVHLIQQGEVDKLACDSFTYMMK